MASAAAFRRNVQAFVDRTLSPEAQSKHLAAVAKRELASLIASGRASPSFRRFVDGKEGAPEESVGPAPGGNIVYLFSVLGAVIVFALAFLVDRAPNRSGRYRKSFYVGVNGKLIPMAQFNPDHVPADAEIVIGNTQPHSRKVDVQFVGGRKLRFNVPPGLFDDAVAAIRARYGSMVNVKRVYTMEFPGQYRLKNEQFHGAGKRAGRPRKRQGSRVESPALIITPIR